MGEKLKLIDFSNGIKQTEIQHNFNVVQSEINKERRAVGGPGISYGFDLSLNGFTLSIAEGCLIANDGSEVYIDPITMSIDKPILIEKNELDLSIDEYNRIKLLEKPYALTRNTTSDNVDLINSGVTVLSAEDNNIKLSIANIKDNYITLNPITGLSDMAFDVFYNITYKRRDVIFIDTNYKLQYRQGITSPSPSVPEVKDDEYLYMLGYLEIDGFGVDVKGLEIATVKFVKDFTSVRNVYTDNNNKLYLCGTAFDSFKTIHTTEPTDPEEYELWYDSFSNELKVWIAGHGAVLPGEAGIAGAQPGVLYPYAGPCRRNGRRHGECHCRYPHRGRTGLHRRVADRGVWWNLSGGIRQEFTWVVCPVCR
jgi:hypothetical protein